MNQELLDRLDVLAATLQTTTEHLWSVLVHQAQVAIIECVVGLLLGSGAIWLSTKWFKAAREHDFADDHLGHLIGSVLFGLTGVVFFTVAVLSIWTPLLNPEYYALQKILAVFKSGS